DPDRPFAGSRCLSRRASIGSRRSPSGTTVVKKSGSSASCSSKGTDMDRRTFLTLTLAAPALVRDLRVPLEAAPPAGIPWTQWGGPHRNFQTEATGLKDTWPTSGPRVI